jgi:predicted transcriptional regulator
MRFPQVTGSNLLRRKVTLPDDLQGKLKILFIAFQQWQQTLVDSWVSTARQLEQSFPGVQFYETPVIQKMNAISQTIINEGMRAGIPNQATREKTITLYIDKKALRRALEIPNEDTIWVLMLDRQGNVLWRAEGAYSQEKGEALLNTIQEHSAVNKTASS